MGNQESRQKLQGCVQKLMDEEVPRRQRQFWTELWRLPTTEEETFALIQPIDVRHLRTRQPANLSTLVDSAAAILRQSHKSGDVSHSELLTSIRLLTRVIPVILEEPGDDYVDRLFWDERNDLGGKPLAGDLLHSIMYILFLPDFTIPRAAYKDYLESLEGIQKQTAQDRDDPNLVHPSLLWSGGMFTDAVLAGTAAMHKNRREVLKLLLVCFSGCLYQKPEEYDSMGNKWLAEACASSCPCAATLFYSLMNTALSYDPVGWGIPYASSLMSDEREGLVDTSLQVLVILLDFRMKEDEGESGTRRKTMGNIYRHHLRAISSEGDLEVAFAGVARLLSNSFESQNTYLPHSVKRVNCQQEMLVLLWRMLDECVAFMDLVLKREMGNKLAVALLYLMCDSRNDPSKVGLIQICTFILLLLSGERSFGVSLNKPLDTRLHKDLPLFTGTHADLLVVTLHKLIVSDNDRLHVVYNCFLTIISNISPYCKRLAMVSAVRMLRLFKYFSSKRFLFRNATNHSLLSLVLDAFNNIIQYQYEGNQTLVYAIIQERELFYKLRDLNCGTSKTEEVAETVRPSTDSALKASEAVRRGESSSKHHPAEDFTATAEWLESWKIQLPLAPVLRLLRFMEPQIDEMCRAKDGPLDEDTVMRFLQNTTMVGVLPVPHPIVIRKYEPNQFTNLWFTTYTWGVIFLRNQELPLFDGTAIKLFVINVL